MMDKPHMRFHRIGWRTMSDKSSRHRNRNVLFTALYISGVGVLFAVWIILGYLLAAWSVDRFGAPSMVKALGAIAGMVIGIVNIILLVKRYLGEQDG